MFRSSHQRCSMKKGILRNSTKFTGKHLVSCLKACNFIKKETLAEVFSCEFCEISKNTFFTEHLWTTASGITCVTVYVQYFFLILVLLQVELFYQFLQNNAL